MDVGKPVLLEDGSVSLKALTSWHQNVCWDDASGEHCWLVEGGMMMVDQAAPEAGTAVFGG